MMLVLFFLFTIVNGQCIRKDGYKTKENSYLAIGDVDMQLTTIDICEEQCIQVDITYLRYNVSENFSVAIATLGTSNVRPFVRPSVCKQFV